MSESEDSGIQPGRAVSVKGFASVACFSRVRASIVARVSGARVLHRLCRRGEMGVVRVGVVRCGEIGGLSEIVWAVGGLVGECVSEQVALFGTGGLWGGLLGSVGVCVVVDGWGVSGVVGGDGCRGGVEGRGECGGLGVGDRDICVERM